MKKLFYFLIAIMFLGACGGSKKLLEKGEYSEAVDKAVKKLQRKSDSEKDLEVLKVAYPLANKKNRDRIEFLNKEGRPDRWDEIYKEYLALHRRQEDVQTVVPAKLRGKTINFNAVDYSEDIIRAKKNAAAYYYAHGKKLMEQNTKDAYRQAYHEFRRTKEYSANYQDVDALLRESEEKAYNYILITIKDATRSNMPPEAYEEIMNLQADRFNVDWNRFFAYANPPRNETFDYTIEILLKDVFVSPEQIKESTFTESREIQDGYEYEYDANGNVKKDSLGNDIKRVKYKTISCKVIETKQIKMARLGADIRFIDNSSRTTTITRPAVAEHFFEHISRLAQGDLNALSRETHKTIGTKPVPFPNDMDMILAASGPFRDVVHGIIHQNRKRFN